MVKWFDCRKNVWKFAAMPVTSGTEGHSEEAVRQIQANRQANGSQSGGLSSTKDPPSHGRTQMDLRKVDLIASVIMSFREKAFLRARK